MTVFDKFFRRLYDDMGRTHRSDPEPDFDPIPVKSDIDREHHAV